MDYLPSVRNPASRLPDVPVLAKDYHVYEGPFETFASHAPDLGNGSADLKERCADYSGFVQMWLFFGTLQEYFAAYGLPFDRSDFITPDGNVTLRTLTDYLLASVAQDRKCSDLSNVRLEYVSEEAIEDYKRLRTRIKRLHAILLHAHAILMHDVIQESVEAVIWDSIIILCGSLSSAKDNMYRKLNLRSQQEFQTVSFGNFRLRSVSDFRDNPKWCPHERRVIADVVEARIPEIAFLSQLDVFETKHENHAKCNMRECVAYQIEDEGQYVTQHTRDGCDCAFAGFDIDHFTDAAKSRFSAKTITEFLPDSVFKSVEAITFWKGKLLTKHMALTMTKASGRIEIPVPGCNLVALSHVWANGLGNPRESKLPKCQLERIQSLANSLYDAKHHPVPFWIDTILLPARAQVQTDTQQRAKTLALQSMEWVYKSASKVLVLDRDLYTTTTDGMGSEELGARIMCCPWTRRLWTLQEGCKKARTYFQFHDRAVVWPKLHKQISESAKPSNWRYHSQLSTDHPIRKAQLISEGTKGFGEAMASVLLEATKSLMTSSQETTSGDKKDILEVLAIVGWMWWSGEPTWFSAVINPVWHSVALFLEGLTLDWTDGGPMTKPFQGHALEQCMRAMYHRNVSRREDEPLVLASMLAHKAGLAAKIAATAKVDRYKTLMHQVRFVPAEILFADQTRYDSDGERWIPTSLLGANSASDAPPRQAEYDPDKDLYSRNVSSLCKPTAGGLIVKLDGLRLESPFTPSPQFHIEFRGELWRVEAKVPGQPDTVFPEVKLGRDWVLIPEELFVGKPLQCRAILVEVVAWNRLKHGARTNLIALATLTAQGMANEHGEQCSPVNATCPSRRDLHNLGESEALRHQLSESSIPEALSWYRRVQEVLNVDEWVVG